MKAAMDGEGEIAYTADVGMTQFHDRTGGFKDYKPTKPEIVHTWYAYPMESMMATAAKGGEKYNCWSDFSGKPVFFTPAGFMNWLNFQRIFKALGYEFKHVQIDPSRIPTRCRPAPSSARPPIRPPVNRWRPTGRRPRSAWTSRSSIRARTRSRS